MATNKDSGTDVLAFAAVRALGPVAWVGYVWEPSNVLHLRTADGRSWGVSPDFALQEEMFDLDTTTPERAAWLRTYASALVAGAPIPGQQPPDMAMMGRWSSHPGRVGETAPEHAAGGRHA